MNVTFDYYQSFINTTQSLSFPYTISSYTNYPQYSYNNFFFFYPETLYNYSTTSSSQTPPVVTQSQQDNTIEEPKQITTVIEEKNEKPLLTLLNRKKKRSIKLCTACPHKFAVHYAKNMCSNCYHSRGRSKRPWKCPHMNKAHYALGLCQNCYQMNYIKKQCEQDTKSVSKGSFTSTKVDTNVTMEKI